MSGHTPGPWWTDARYRGDEMGCPIIAARTDCGPLPGNPTRGMVAFASAGINTKARECEANARLIAAAPDLLAVCKALVEVAAAHIPEAHGPHPNPAYEPIESARAAIAKAEQP